VSELTEKDFQLLRGTLRRWRNYALAGAPITPSVGVIDKLSAALDSLYARQYNDTPKGDIGTHSVPLTEFYDKVTGLSYAMINLEQQRLYEKFQIEEATLSQLVEMARQFGIDTDVLSSIDDALHAIRSHVVSVRLRDEMVSRDDQKGVVWEQVNETMTRQQLVDIAKQYNVPIVHNAKKADILAAIQEHMANGQ
jgi:hypothetical protein